MLRYPYAYATVPPYATVPVPVPPGGIPPGGRRSPGRRSPGRRSPGRGKHDTTFYPIFHMGYNP